VQEGYEEGKEKVSLPSDFELLKKSTKRPRCLVCSKEISKERGYAITCSFSCQTLKEEREKKTYDDVLEVSCMKCGLAFRRPELSVRNFRCDACKYEKRQSGYKKNKIAEANENFLLGKKKPERTQAQRTAGDKMERNRVWNPKQWDRYEKGRKWFKI
jgi:hypothetical protein